MRLSPRNYDRLQDFVHQSYMPVIESIESFLQLERFRFILAHSRRL